MSTSTAATGAAPTATDRRKQWEEVRRAIASRRSQQPQPDSEPSVLGDQSHEQVLAEMGDELASFEALGPVLSAVFDQGLPLFVECLETLPEGSTGKLQLRADVIGEPDLGAIVETVEVVDDSLDQPAFEECLRESAYAITLDAIGQPISKSLDITVDMEDRSLSINAELELDHFTDMPTENPELWAELLSDPKGVENLAELLKVPGLAEQHPEFVAAIEAALAESKPAE